jgi:hypothetical protein
MGVLGCASSPVQMDAHTPIPGTTAVCADLVEALPETVSDAVRRQVSPPSPGVAAWGQPPVLLRCGVPAATGADPTTAVLEVDGVGWLPVPGTGGTFFSTVDRVAVVEVAVPDDYAPEADVLADLAPAVSATVPPTASSS